MSVFFSKQWIRYRLLFAMVLALLLLLGVGIWITSSFYNEEEFSDQRIYISEIMLSNQSAYPYEDGNFYDWIELYNGTDEDVNLFRYGLSDNDASVKWRFPSGTVIKSGGYLVVFCDESLSNASGLRAPFGISKKGKDEVILVNDGGFVVDRVATVACGNNQAYAYVEGKWVVTDQCTPGYANTSVGREAFLASFGGDTVDCNVKISEVAAKNLSCFLDENGHASDWIELYNAGESDADLTGCWLSNDAEHLFEWQIPSLILKPRERIVIFCSDSSSAGDNTKELHTAFRLKATYASVYLTTKRGTVIDMVTYANLPNGCAYALLEDGSYVSTPYITPGYPNTKQGYEDWCATTPYTAPKAAAIGVIISEIMASQSGTYPDGDGDYSDWIELMNITEKEISLEGFFLSDLESDLYQWKFPAVVLAPNSRLIVFASGKGNTGIQGNYALHTSFKLSSVTETVYVSSPSGQPVDVVTYRNLPKEYTLIRESKQDPGTVTRYPTPGYSNDAKGYAKFLEEREGQAKPSLVINEVMLANTSYLKQKGKYYDWIELLNDSGENINLSEYYLSDDQKDPFRYQLPNKTLKAGGMQVVIASGNVALTGTFPHAGFRLGLGEVLHLFRKDGTLVDSILLVEYPKGTSQGREQGEYGFFYFTAPTPGKANGQGIRYIASTPKPSVPGGVYNQTTAVTVILEGNGTIYYTLDGSIPTMESICYTEPIRLSKTTVLRTVAYAQGYLKSFVGTYTYLINENHTLPVVSLSANPEDLFNKDRGIYMKGNGASSQYPYKGANYWLDIEVLSHVEYFYAGEDGFSLDCGLKIFGGYSRALGKKSFQLKFREKYGASTLQYPVFAELDVQSFSSLVLRSGSSDYVKAMMRDEMFTSLAADAGMNVAVQANRGVVLYINGEYWGVYYVREKTNEEWIAKHYGVSEESVTILFGVGTHWKNGKINADYASIIRYVSSHDMSKPENYAYIESKVDVTSLIDWYIAEAYARNTDLGNIRFFKSDELDGKWHWIYYDLDLTWNTHSNHIAYMFSVERTGKQNSTLVRNLLKNKTFRNLYLERLSGYLKTSYSNAAVLAKIEAFEKMLEPEMERNAIRWNTTEKKWKSSVRYLKNYVSSSATNRAIQMAKYADDYFKLSDKEYAYYFGDIPS